MKPYNIYIHKAADSVISTKFFIFITSSLLLLAGKISSDNWVNLAMVLAGFHTANTLSSIMKGVPPIIPRGAAIDNPDEE